ncbi:MAG: HEAT repeat domain-containing protein [Planctomycetota bacterium]|jgi:HEAT repeat protein
MAAGYVVSALVALSVGALAFGVLRAGRKKWRAAALLGAAAVLLAGLAIGLLYSWQGTIRRAREHAERRPSASRTTIKEALERHFEMSRGGERRIEPKDPESGDFAREVAALGEEAVPQIREAMASLGPEYHDVLVGTVAWLAKAKSDKAALEYLRELAASGQFRAVEYLGMASASDEDLQRLKAILEGGTDRRYAALRSLGETRRPEAVSILAPYLDDEEDAVRSNAANALAKIGTAEAKRLLVARLPKETSRRTNSYWAVLGGLMRMGYAPAMETHERELASVLAAEERDEFEVSHIVRAAMSVADRSRREEMCLAMLRSTAPYKSLKVGAVNMLGSVGPLSQESARALLDVLCDESVEGVTRYFAARSLNAGTSHHVELGTTADKKNLDRLRLEWRALLP